MATATLTTADDLMLMQLRTALTMEADSLAALGDLQRAAKSADVKKMFKHHAGETKEQIENLHKIFEMLGMKPTPAPSPSTKGISKQAGSLITKSAPKLRDQVTLSCALGNEHYEIAAYQNMIIPALAMGGEEIAALLQANLDQEAHTSEELKAELERRAS